MADENYTFTQARTRLEEIVTQVRSKDVSLEKSLDLLEEGVRLANICTEQSDHTEWRSVIEDENGNGAGDSPESAEGDAEVSEASQSAEQTFDSTQGDGSDRAGDSDAAGADEALGEAPESDADTVGNEVDVEEMAPEGESSDEASVEMATDDTAASGELDSVENSGDTSEEEA